MHIETNRLIIREFTADDWDSIHAYASDPEVTKYMLWGPNSVKETNEYIEFVTRLQKENPRTGFEWAVTIKENGQMIGGVGIFVTDCNGEIGYCLRKDFWGQGIMTEAAESVMRFGFMELDLHRIYATCRPENTASRRIMEKLGMTREGLIREHKYAKGKFHSSLQYSILKDEYFSAIQQPEGT
jgi:[ribosomal protein S5]-alanine N-acetyltransferase